MEMNNVCLKLKGKNANTLVSFGLKTVLPYVTRRGQKSLKTQLAFTLQQLTSKRHSLIYVFFSSHPVKHPLFIGIYKYNLLSKTN